jgi:DNA topoisomerase IB
LDLAMPRLRRVDCSEPGITRIRRGRGFSYVDACGEPVRDPETLARIKALVIPPAWKDVWISPVPNGHIQALGTDDAGRRQYRYHDAWRARRDIIKFDHALEFAQHLPALRERVAEHLSLEGMPPERVLAAAVRLLDRGFFRVGGETYAEQNQSYGLATIEKRHVTIEGDEVTFDYTAKSGKRRVLTLRDPEVLPVLTVLKRRRTGGRDLLAWQVDGRWVDLRSGDINDYLKAETGGDFSAKDFRTWSATVLAAVGVAVSGTTAKSRTARKRAVTRVVKEVADYLGNTPAVARASYIDPRVFDRYSSGLTIAGALEKLGAVGELGEPSFQGPVEAAVLDLIADRQGVSLEQALAV